jgi:hypothetical protein
VAEVEVVGAVGADEPASFGEGELSFAQQDESLVLAQDALDVGVFRACHTAIIARLRRRAQGGGPLRSPPTCRYTPGKAKRGPPDLSGGSS